MTVTSVLLDDILQNPENPTDDHIHVIDIKVWEYGGMRIWRYENLRVWRYGYMSMDEWKGG